MRFAWLSLVLVTGCGFFSAPGEPLVIAHRIAAGNWPENSRTALLSALEQGYPGLEIDLVLTKDLVPVLSHDPWLDGKYCTDLEGVPLPERIDIQDLTLAELQGNYRCGGLPDEAFPAVTPVADTHVTFDEFIEALRDHPSVLAHLDVKYEPGHTPSAEVFAEEILRRWHDAALPNPWYVSANLPELIRAFKDRDANTPTTLIWPRFTDDTSDTAVALKSEFGRVFGVIDPIKVARDCGADGLAMPYQIIDRHLVETAKAKGLQVQVWTPNSEALLSRFCRWPVDVIITDFPERAACL